MNVFSKRSVKLLHCSFCTSYSSIALAHSGLWKVYYMRPSHNNNNLKLTIHNLTLSCEMHKVALRTKYLYKQVSRNLSSNCIENDSLLWTFLFAYLRQFHSQPLEGRRASFVTALNSSWSSSGWICVSCHLRFVMVYILNLGIIKLLA